MILETQYHELLAQRDALRKLVEDTESTNAFLRSTLLRCADHAGMPDPATGCRAVITAVKDALAIP